jgi:DNA-binding LytR/AlgR family response regulator
MDTFLTRLDTKKRKRCLVKNGSSYEFVAVEDIALAYSEDSVTFLITKEGKRHIYNRTIEQLASELDEEHHFQVNRGQIISIDNIEGVHPHLGQRLKLSLKEFGPLEEIYVSRKRVSEFKEWLDS